MNIEHHLDILVPDSDSTLIQAARYALLGGGKRLRPKLTLAVTTHFNGDINKALTPACALEMIHCYSLIHDDLPCMDDDDFRRGKPTVHKQFGEAIAVLAGDYLLTRAFEVLSLPQDLKPEQQLALIKSLSSYANNDGMIGGQVLDIESGSSTFTLMQLQEVHVKKTGALFSAAAVFGGIIANVDDDELERLHRYGGHIGLAFQIQDDINDILRSEEKHGSAIGSDARNRKTTYVTLVGINEAKRLAESERKKARACYDLDIAVT